MPRTPWQRTVPAKQSGIDVRQVHVKTLMNTRLLIPHDSLPALLKVWFRCSPPGMGLGTRSRPTSTCEAGRGDGLFHRYW